ncbi:MAG: HAMP domain-containing sensor histidine kinase [Syntrophomonadaceae bacterium]|nr:HAMP domain-containing sensor histidine kinase [Syntrophomonadaceae bacterium]
MLYAMLLVTLAAMAAAYAFSPTAAVATGAACLLLSALFLGFTRRRYRLLARLGDYLKRVNHGEYPLELPDNDEGELSILKSEIYKVTVSLREQNERLKQDKLRLADALSDISHQFKTPLTSMSVMTDLLADGKLDESRRTEFTTQLQAQLERLTWLTEALLKLSRLDAEAVSFKPRLVPLLELINKACSPLLIPLELKEQTLIIEAEGGLCCDLNWTAEALSNILKNCMEHMPNGGAIRIKASTNALFTEIRVSDDGPGIDKTDLPYIFDRFYRGKEAAKDSVGIGLAMAKAILDTQGGSLEAGNADGGGAEFILRFPADQAQ